jgi:hypothetical protein
MSTEGTHQLWKGPDRIITAIETWRKGDFPMGTLLILLLILLLIGALPTWPYSSSWGYYPSGGLGVVLLIILVLLVMGRL